MSTAKQLADFRLHAEDSGRTAEQQQNSKKVEEKRRKERERERERAERFKCLSSTQSRSSRSSDYNMMDDLVIKSRSSKHSTRSDSRKDERRGYTQSSSK